MDSLIEHITLNYGSIDLSFFCVSLKREDERTPILHRHDYYEIHFGGSGKYEYQFGDKTVSLPPNHIIVIPPDVLHYSVDLLKKPTPTVVSFSMDTSCQDKKLYTSLVSALSDISLKPISFNHRINFLFFSKEIYLPLGALTLTLNANLKLKSFD